MCGITGWVDYKRSLEGERDVVTKMAETLAKRGPDDNKVWIKGNVAFGHKRLIVVDPEGGKQPMTCLKMKQIMQFAITANCITRKIFERNY